MIPCSLTQRITNTVSLLLWQRFHKTPSPTQRTIGVAKFITSLDVFKGEDFKTILIEVADHLRVWHGRMSIVKHGTSSGSCPDSAIVRPSEDKWAFISIERETTHQPIFNQLTLLDVDNSKCTVASIAVRFDQNFRAIHGLESTFFWGSLLECEFGVVN